jgi:predicted nucleic acid-binding protein
LALILDTGPLYASLDRSDAHHLACRALIESSAEALLIPAPVLVEVDHWIRARLHPGALFALLDDIEAGAYDVEDLHRSDYTRIRQICARHAELGVGFVDASVLAIAERLDEPKLASLDHRHFDALRPLHCDALTLLPQ